MSEALKCDEPDCDKWITLDDRNSVDWLVVSTHEGDYHFCSGWHMTRWGSHNYEPQDEPEPQTVIVVYLDDDETEQE